MLVQEFKCKKIWDRITQILLFPLCIGFLSCCFGKIPQRNECKKEGLFCKWYIPLWWGKHGTRSRKLTGNTNPHKQVKRWTGKFPPESLCPLISLELSQRVSQGVKQAHKNVPFWEAFYTETTIFHCLWKVLYEEKWCDSKHMDRVINTRRESNVFLIWGNLSNLFSSGFDLGPDFLHLLLLTLKKKPFNY